MARPLLTRAGRLSEVARHLVLPDGIVSTGWPAVRDRAAEAGVRYDEWQDGLGRAILAKREGGLYAAGIGGVMISICRQVGKTFTVGTMVIFLCILFPGLKVLWTAHRTRTSDETFKSMQGFVRRKRIAPFVAVVRRANGQQEIEFVNGSRIMFGARETGFGRGFDDIDILVFDEAQILSQKALDDMVPATNVAANPLVLFMGTPPRPSDPSEAFTRMRARAIDGHELVEGRVHRTGGDALFAEISADEGADPEDRAQWAKANPSFPHRTPEGSILRMRELLNDPESFLREGLGIWDPKDAGGKGLIPLSVWLATRISGVTPVRPRVAVELRIGLMQSISVAAAYQAAGLDVVDLGFYESGVGVQWEDGHAAEKVAELCGRLGVTSVIVDDGGDGNTLLVPQLESAGISVVRFKLDDSRSAAAGFVDGVLNHRIFHIADQAPLTVAALEARTRPANGGFVWSQPKSAVDVGPIRTASNAWWAMTAAINADYDLLNSFH